MAYFSTRNALLDQKSKTGEDSHAKETSAVELLRRIAQALVDFPEKVEVNHMDGNQTVVLELKVAKEDLGKVIGKQGRTAQAIRTLLSAVAAKGRKRVVMEIVE